MTKRILKICLSIALLMSLFGCAGNNTPQVPISYYKPIKDTKIVKDDTLAKVENGALIFKNGDKVYDEDGDIVAAFTLDNNVFYLLRILDKNLFFIKNANKKVIKKLKATNIIWFTSPNKVILAVKLPGNHSSYYDNIYSFDGKKIKLINKNILLDNGYVTGLYYVNVIYRGQYRDFKGYRIVNMLNGKIVTIKPKYKALLDKYYLLGAIGENLFYIYSANPGDFFSFSLGENVLEVYNPNNGMQNTILDSKHKFQILKAGNQYVLKVFNNTNLTSEFKIWKSRGRINSKYDREPAKYISLNTLKEVKISNNFKPIMIRASYYNLGGSYTPETFITVSTEDLDTIFATKETRKNIDLLF